jgi:hypothetical protein
VRFLALMSGLATARICSTRGVTLKSMKILDLLITVREGKQLGLIIQQTPAPLQAHVVAPRGGGGGVFAVREISGICSGRRPVAVRPDQAAAGPPLRNAVEQAAAPVSAFIGMDRPQFHPLERTRMMDVTTAGRSSGGGGACHQRGSPARPTSWPTRRWHGRVTRQ